MAVKPRIKWGDMFQEYLTAPNKPNKTILAEKYGARLETICRKAKKDNWDFQRDRYQVRVVDKTLEKKAETVSTKAAKWDEKCMTAAETLLDKALIELAAKDSRVGYVAGALKIAQEMGKLSVGEDSNNPMVTFAEAIRKAIEK